MAGAEVTWRMMGDTQSHSIWFKGDYVRRSTTDENGSATVTVEGRPQDTDLTKYKLQPFIRRESVGVTIAVKKAEIKQDMVDAVFGGLGILTLGVGPESNVSLLTFGGAKKGVTGGGAILGPIMEMLYRTDWAYKGFKMNVQDWRGEAMLLDLNINVEGRGVVKSGGHLKKVRVNHSVYFVDGLSQESVVLYPTGQMMTNADSTRLLGGKSATTNMYSTKFPARLGYDIDDRWDWKGMKYGGDCLNPTQRPVDDWKTWTAPVRPGAGYPPIQMGIEIKTAQNKDGVKAWIVTNNFPAIIFEGNSQLPSRITSTMFYAGSTMEKWIRELPIDISSVESRTYKGIGNDPDFLILEASGVETKSDVWFETLGVVGRATWKVTRIIASDPSQLAVINGLNLSRSTIRQSLNTLTAVSGPVRASRQK